VHSLPVFLRLGGRRVVVVGTHAVARRRIDRLLAAGVPVELVAQPLPAGFEHLRNHAAVTLHNGPFQPSLLAGAALVIAASEDPEANDAVLVAARRQGLLVQVIGREAESDFFFPAIIDRAPMILALSSGGAAPALTRFLRMRLDAMLPAGYGQLAELFARYRRRADVLGDRPARRRFWDSIISGPTGEKVFAGRTEEAAADIEALLNKPELMPRGEVYLVGAGPGAADLLTLRALRLMQQADVVLYDALVSPAVVDLVRPEAERIHVGKRASRHTLPQEDINGLMVRLAESGRRVLRLKGGDPFIFGRGGEEIAELAEAGIAFQVVPGITAASGCAAYAGIPLTHRDHAQSVQFVTGHLKSGELDLDWARLVQPEQTLVFYMGLKAMDRICAELRAHGLPDDYPAALVEEGTTSSQRVLCGTLADLPQKKDAADIRGASLLIVGNVVRLNETLGWFRPRHDAR
jgi:uroporphyrin-III C-methyltransferase/precorrin-2 dehydrogenase/sirohydrochlorin ferrochelatase